MSEPMWSAARSRAIVERVVIEGTLVLETPAHFGGGDDGAVMGLVTDAFDARSPLLTGASIAGALRSYLWTRERGYGEAQSDKGRQQRSAAALLFGTSRADDRGEGDQSRLIVDDALGKDGRIVYRDGVRLDETSRTAADNALYAVQLWDAGTKFPLRFELLISEGDDRQRLLSGLLAALTGLAHGEITLGARKRRGYGRVRVEKWRARSYAVGTPQGMLDWLTEGDQPLGSAHTVTNDLFSHFGLKNDFGDARKSFTIDAEFTIDGSLLIRSADDMTDMRHLANKSNQSLASGTSLAGALRARAVKIVNTLQRKAERQVGIVNALFGSPHDQPTGRVGSRITIQEHLIECGTNDRVQSRVSIDRFTGGALDTALFNQQPHFGGKLRLHLHLANPQDHEIGLLLLILKDLWTGDLPIGGERSVGRGRLRGQRATITINEQQWTLCAGKESLEVTPDAASLEQYVKALTSQSGVSQ